MQVPEYPAETILTFTTVPLKLGFGAADEVGYEAKRLEAKRALICTDKNLRATGHPDRIQKIIEEEGIGAEIYFSYFHSNDPEQEIISNIAYIEYLTGKFGRSIIPLYIALSADPASYRMMFPSPDFDLLLPNIRSFDTASSA